MTIQHWLQESMASRGETVAVAGPWGLCSYQQILERVDGWAGMIKGFEPGSVVAFDGDYGPGTISLLLALTWNGHIAVPLSRDVSAHHQAFMEVSQSEYWITNTEGAPVVHRMPVSATHQLYAEVRNRRAPGLILFSSGSTGAHKCALHDLSALLDKFRTPRHGYRTLVFLQLDHIGGINTLFYTLANGGSAVVATERTPPAVCQAIAQHRVELLPTSPTFLNLLLLSEAHLGFDLSSLSLITYGTEPMPESTLKQVSQTFPGVRLLQTYGLSELGILRSQSRSSDSLWVRVGGEGFETKVVDGRLWIRAKSAMLGYLNAPSPFDAEGFFDTGDLVDVDGEWLRFKGRHNEIINVGGSKVYPAEVESVLLELDNVADVTVTGERSPITGQVVTATVRLVRPETPEDFKVRMRQFCASRLSRYKIPVRIRLVETSLHSERFKRRRLAHDAHG
jgi:acyl-CoA synthetase (AMP-forming)/AMP-acid ligase II